MIQNPAPVRRRFQMKFLPISTEFSKNLMPSAVPDFGDYNKILHYCQRTDKEAIRLMFYIYSVAWYNPIWTL